MSSPNMRQLWVYVPPDMEAAIRREAALMGMSLSDVVRGAIERHLSDTPATPKRAKRR